MRSSTIRCPPASAIAIAIAMPALRASRMAVETMCLAPSWVRRLASAIYMEVVPLLWGTSVTIQGGPVDRARIEHMRWNVGTRAEDGGTRFDSGLARNVRTAIADVRMSG